MGSQAPPLMQCYLVNSVATDPLEQCKFLIHNNCLEQESFIDYVYLIYCRIGYDFRLLVAVLIICLVILLFLAISAIADDFLCTSLLTVSRNLHMSDSLAGITLLAFGNGCPDIFSSIAAAYDSRSEMIIGELLGAGIFCTSVVSGLVFINSDFKLACRPILRDTAFYLLAVYLIWCYSWNGFITFYGAISFIIIYLVYLTVALCGQVLGSRLRGNYVLDQQQQHQQHPSLGSASSEATPENGSWFRRREESLKRRQAPLNREKPVPPAVIRVDYNEGVTSVHLGSGAAPDSDGPPRYLKAAAAKAPLEIQLFSSLKHERRQHARSPNMTRSAGSGKPASGSAGFSNHAFVEDAAAAAAANQQPQSKQPLKFQLREPASSPGGGWAGGGGGAKLPAAAADMWPRPGPSEWDSFLAHLNPIETADWRTISLTARIIRILRAPMVLAAQLTIPVVDNQKILNNWCRPLNALHLITVPLFIMLTTGLGGSSSAASSEPPAGHIEPSSTGGGAGGAGGAGGLLSGLLGLPAPSAELLLGALLAGYLFHLTEPHQAPRYHAAFAYVGFGMSVFWVYLLASEMISLMKTIGLVFGMSDTAIGLGILAWGNSLGDIVSNYSLTKANYPRMALGACIGAPLLNLLLGFGLSFSTSLQPGQWAPIRYSATITLLCSTLALILLALMLTTLMPASASKKPIGYLLICVYLIYFVAAICLEYKLINL